MEVVFTGLLDKDKEVEQEKIQQKYKKIMEYLKYRKHISLTVFKKG